ncbi:MAG: ribonucleoside hydrolase RihC [Emergencia sp.]
MKRKPIIIDTDPGIDDAAALVIALRNPQLDVKLLSTVAANVEVDKTTANALKLTEFLDVDVPVARGCDAPLLKTLEPSSHIHGESGMDGYEFPPVTRKPLNRHSVEVMREMILESPEKITLVPIGTQTNIAILLRMYPEVKENIEEIVTMGGGIGAGNTTSAAEFNFYNDPHAAAMVFRSGVPLTMLGLNVTNHALLHMEGAQKIKASGRVGEMLFDLFSFYRGGTLEEGLRIHDACTICYLLHPEFFRTESRFVEIATEGPAMGASVMRSNLIREDDREPKVNVCMDIDSEKFEAWFVEELCR